MEFGFAVRKLKLCFVSCSLCLQVCLARVEDTPNLQFVIWLVDAIKSQVTLYALCLSLNCLSVVCRAV